MEGCEVGVDEAVKKEWGQGSSAPGSTRQGSHGARV